MSPETAQTVNHGMSIDLARLFSVVLFRSLTTQKVMATTHRRPSGRKPAGCRCVLARPPQSVAATLALKPILPRRPCSRATLHASTHSP